MSRNVYIAGASGIPITRTKGASIDVMASQAFDAAVIDVSHILSSWHHSILPMTC